MKKFLLALASLFIFNASDLSAQAGAALNFDGVNDFVGCGNILNPSYTKEAWIRVTNMSLSNNIISGGPLDGMHCLYVPMGNGNRLSAGHNGTWNYVMDPTPIVAATWYHVAVTYDAATTTMKLYKNGVLVSSNSAVPAYTTGNAVRLGAYGANSYLFGGDMDEVKIWNYARTITEINASMNCELTGTESGLRQYYQFNQGIAGGNNTGITTLTDIAGVAQNGNLSNFALTGATSNWIAPGGVVTGTSCCSTASVTLTSQTNVLCNGSSTGSATVTASGGVTFTYSWAPSGGTAATASLLAAGTYTCTVTNECSSTATVSVTITQPTALVASALSQTNISCNGGSNGAASVSVTGGTTAYSYNWTPGNPTGDGTTSVTGLTTGTWTCTVTDANSCTTTQTFNITQPVAITLTAASQTNISCNGGANGAASVNAASGGTSPYTYNWTPGNPTGDGTVSVTGLTAGTWTCTVTDANGCSTTRTFSITQPTAITATTTQTNITCFGSCNGAASVTASGGVSPYTYNWSPSGGTGSSTSGRCAGTYTCTITDANGCTTTKTFNITQPTALVASPSSQTNISCNGGSNGAAAVTVSGGTTAYSYNWTPGNPTGDGTNSVTGLTSGTWTCTVTDANGCTTTQTFNITQPSALSATTMQTNVTCFGGANGSAMVMVSGGTTAYSYSWSPSGGTAANAASLTAGGYTCTITDANGCTLTKTFLLTSPAAVSGTFSVTNSTCFGSNNGSATITPSGGSGGYSYSWSPSGGTAATASSLSPATYTCTVTDMNGCVGTPTVTVSQPGPIVITPTQTNITCFGSMDGTATASSTGGTGAHTYLWSPTGGTGAVETGLDVGSYTCTVTDANGCTSSQTFQITEPPQLTATNTSTDVTCFGNTDGTASILVSGGVPSYSYSWAPGGYITASVTGLAENMYIIDITDASGCTLADTITINAPAAILPSITSMDITCNGANDGMADVTVLGGTSPYTYSWSPGGAATSTVTGLAGGSYTCTITDANGCSTTQTVAIVEPSALSSTFSQIDAACFGGNSGSATVNVSGGTSPYNYSWSPSGGTSSTASGLVAGTYTCTTTDVNGCSLTNTFQITEPGAIMIFASQYDVSCFGGNNGSATVNVSGGTGAVTYAWSSGGTNVTESSLVAGSYTCTVTDANGCVGTQTFLITEPGSMLTNAVVTDVMCGGGNTGSIVLNMTGGNTPYYYYWSTGSNASSITGLIAGTYSITIQDVNSCTITQTFTITEPTPMLITSSTTDPTCNGQTGSASVTVSGGSGTTYSYSWSPSGGSSSTATNLAAGSYTCYVTDSVGCVDSAMIFIIEPGPITPFVQNHLDPSSCGATNGGINLNLSGGSPPFSYLWSNSATTQDLLNIGAGVYTVTVTDANGCTGTLSYTLNDPNAPSVSLLLPTSFICHDDAPLALSGGSPSGGTFGGIGVTGSTFDPNASGNGTIIISYTFTDSLGCTGAGSDTLIVDPCLGFAPSSDQSSFNLYPNPTTGDVFIQGELKGDVQLECYSSEGKLVFSRTILSGDELKFSLNNEADGIYLVRIISPEATRSFRIIKQ